jgi:putative mRNA 3-end processing factor
MGPPLLSLTDRGLYCGAGDFYIDPWEPVERAVITHAHSDHLRPGSRVYVTARTGAAIVRARLGGEGSVEPVEYGESVARDGVRVTLHPAGHILGSAQVRIEHAGEVWVVSGDYKLDPDPTCASFTSLLCHVFVTECTFGLPVYRWRPQAETIGEIEAWWGANQAAGKASVLFAYALGKAQRVLAGLDASIGPIYTHGAVERYCRIYRESGVELPPTVRVADAPAGTDWTRALILGPPMASNAPWLRRFGRISTALASGWMRIRGTRRRRSLDRGFVLSDHADWPQLMTAMEASGAAQVWTTHGYREVMARWLREKGVDAQAVETRYESDAAAEETEE